MSVNRPRFRNPKLEISPEDLQEGGVETHFFFLKSKAEAGTDALALKLNRDQDERRTIWTDAFLRLPLEKAETQEKDVGAALLEGEACVAKEIGEARLGVLLRGLRVELVSGQSLGEIGAATVLAWRELSGWLAIALADGPRSG